MKAYKGFNKDLTCRGFQYKEGETYHVEKAELCKEGFHACENPLDCFAYHNPGKSVYHEVNVDELAEVSRKDSTVCGKTIKIGAALDVAGICKAHFEYVDSRTTNHDQDGDCSSLADEDRISLDARDWSSLAARDGSSLSAREWSSLAAQNCSSLAARDGSSLAVQNWSSLAARDCSSLAARHWSSLAVRNWSSLAAQNNSSLAARDGSSLAARECSSLAARSCSSLAAQGNSSLSAGQNSVLAAFNSKAKAGLGSIIAIANREFDGKKWVVTDWAACVVDGEKIKADTWYKVENGQFVEADIEDQK